MKGLSQKTVFRLVALLAVCAFILANLCAGRLALILGLSLDFTGERLYSLSEQTKLAVSALRTETTVYVINDEASYPPVLREILGRYALLSAKIDLRYVDPYADPGFADDYIEKGFALRESDLLVEGVKGLRHIPAGDVFIYDGEGAASGLCLEEKLTNALVYVNSGRGFSASFTVGHGEGPAPSLEDALTGGGFSVKNLALAAGERPETDIVVIAGPERDFLPEETATLGAYLAAGGRLMAFMGPGGGLPELEALLGSWGLSLLPGALREPLAHTPGNPASLIPMYGMHEINLDFAERRYYLAMPGARALKLDDDGFRTSRLLLSTRDARIADNSSSPRGSGDSEGPFVLAAVVESPAGNAAAGGAAEKSGGGPAVMLFGSGGIYAGDIMAASAYANREYLARAALWLAGRGAGESFSIPPRTLAPPSVNAGFGLTLAVLLVFAGLLPLSALAVGALTLLGRRRR
ncbi:MAG: GldG family protein [Treponema sp.]|jgi:hypothetical protein|nr:GldG family protein [Treponema sp.]